MFICSNCQATTLKWTGKCPSCGEWNTLTEWRSGTSKWKKEIWLSQKTEKIDTDKQTIIERLESSSSELDGVLGGGISPGSLILLSGEPGIGKSTLALQMSQWYAEWGRWATRGVRVLYVSGEEHIGQISGRATRLGVSHPSIDILANNLFEDILATIRESEAQVVIIDSISVLASDMIEGASGSISQIRTMTEAFMHLAKTTKKSILLIGHVTKDGSISGPKALEHLVDVVLFLEGSRTDQYRILRSFKNRFGSTDTIGLFRMEERGLIDIPNPGLEFVDEANFALPGSALSITIEGNRPLLIEIEALTTYTKFGYPKRSARGISQGKLDLLIAVLSKYTSTKLESSDVYLNISRWLTLSEPWVDLACLAAIISSKKEKPLGRKIYLWEVSLTGVVKNTFMLERRISEAIKLWFTELVIPKSYTGKIDPTIQVERIETIKDLHI